MKKKSKKVLSKREQMLLELEQKRQRRIEAGLCYHEVLEQSGEVSLLRYPWGSFYYFLVKNERTEIVDDYAHCWTAYESFNEQVKRKEELKLIVAK